MSPFHHALLQTHHITSRVKLHTLHKSAKQLNVYVLVRSGGVPGIMYVCGDDEDAVRKWVDVVKGLRYKGFRIVKGVDVMEQSEVSVVGEEIGKEKGVEEMGSLREVGAWMEERGLGGWWRGTMGFENGNGNGKGDGG